MLTASDLIKNQMKRDEKRKEVFDVILLKCCQKIRKCDEVRLTYCVFEIPEYVFGFPLYKLQDCVQYLLTELKKKEFKVKFAFPVTLIITWQNRKLLH